MAKCKKWTKDEDMLLLRQVQAFPHRKARCFMAVAQSTGRTRKAVEHRYYAYLRGQEESHMLDYRQASGKLSLWKRIKRCLSW